MSGINSTYKSSSNFYSRHYSSLTEIDLNMFSYVLQCENYFLNLIVHVISQNILNNGWCCSVIQKGGCYLLHLNYVPKIVIPGQWCFKKKHLLNDVSYLFCNRVRTTVCKILKTNLSPCKSDIRVCCDLICRLSDLSAVCLWLHLLSARTVVALRLTLDRVATFVSHFLPNNVTSVKEKSLCHRESLITRFFNTGFDMLLFFSLFCVSNICWHNDFNYRNWFYLRLSCCTPYCIKVTVPNIY